MEHLVLKANSNRNSMSKGYTNEEVKKWQEWVDNRKQKKTFEIQMLMHIEFI